MSALLKSWVETANQPASPFPLNNLPYGVFSTTDKAPRCGVAIGDVILDCAAAEQAGLITFNGTDLLQSASWNSLMASGRANWTSLRNQLVLLLQKASPHQEKLTPLLTSQADAIMHMPFTVSEFTDFYAGYHHAKNVGTMFRGPENALPVNWLHMPIGYNGRASSVVISGTDIKRPSGQIKQNDQDNPIFAPSNKFDFELELGAVIGLPSDRRLSVDEADDMIFGYVLLNDWSARDIQAWEYQPLGPFQAKATATTISPWIVTADALAPFRTSTPPRKVELLAHIKDTKPMGYDIALNVSLKTGSGTSKIISQTNTQDLYYSSAQQLAHHTSSGCPMRVGDLLGSGTISGVDPLSRGSLLELSWGGKEPLQIGDEERSFLHDYDTITFTGTAVGDGFTIGFGTCSGTILPAEKT